jgi:hypothetical protein
MDHQEPARPAPIRTQRDNSHISFHMNPDFDSETVDVGPSGVSLDAFDNTVAREPAFQDRASRWSRYQWNSSSTYQLGDSSNPRATLSIAGHAGGGSGGEPPRGSSMSAALQRAEISDSLASTTQVSRVGTGARGDRSSVFMMFRFFCTAGIDAVVARILLQSL